MMAQFEANKIKPQPNNNHKANNKTTNTECSELLPFTICSHDGMHTSILYSLWGYASKILWSTKFMPILYAPGIVCHRECYASMHFTSPCTLCYNGFHASIYFSAIHLKPTLVLLLLYNSNFWLLIIIHWSFRKV